MGIPPYLGEKMLTLSRYTHVLKIDENTSVLWNSLRMRAIFLGDPLFHYVEHINSETSFDDFKGQFPISLASNADELIQRMIEQKFWINQEEDQIKISEIRDRINQLPVAIMYLILSTKCNLRCRYCYLSKSVKNNCRRGNMPIKTIKKAVDLLKDTIKTNGIHDPEIIFYGGEPLLNPKGLLFTLKYTRRVIPNCKFTINTNGTLITDAIAKILKQYDVLVSISIDGPKKIHDQERVDVQGQGSFDRVIAGIKILQDHNVKTSVSCTISPANMNSLRETIEWFIDDLKVKGIDLNLMLGDFGNDQIRSEYAYTASKQLVGCYKLAKDKGILIDRMMRIVRPLAKGTANFNSCAGCGQQIVVAPNGLVGVCQGNLNTMQDFVEIGDASELIDHQLWTKWRKRSPFNIDECLKCEALSVCGGGCPYSARLVSGDIMSLNTIYCAFAKEALHSLIVELWNNKKAKSMV